MIGFLAFAVAVLLFMALGYVILLGSFELLLLFLVIATFMALGILPIVGALWEFYFPKPAKTLISARARSSSISLIADDAGLLDIVGSKKVFPEGLIEHKLGFTFLPKPFREKVLQSKIGKRRGRKPKNPEEAEKRQSEFQELERLRLEREATEREVAQAIASRRLTLRGMGKPIWLEYAGLAAAFNPLILVPGEVQQQDNPHGDIQKFQNFVKSSPNLTDDAKENVLKEFDGLVEKLNQLRLVLDPRRFKEVHPRMYTRDHISAHRHINFERGRQSVEGMPLGKIMVILVVVLGVIGALAVVYMLFMKPTPQPQQTAALIHSFIHII